jgi:hypothetical protein
MAYGRNAELTVIARGPKADAAIPIIYHSSIIIVYSVGGALHTIFLSF